MQQGWSPTQQRARAEGWTPPTLGPVPRLELGYDRDRSWSDLRAENDAALITLATVVVGFVAGAVVTWRLMRR